MARSDLFLAGDPSANPRGLESQLVYNDLVLNDRLAGPDRYLITEIDGLSDANIRDSREDNPARHGQSPYQSYYSGRTITITGQIQAGNLNKLRSMTQELHSAFNSLEELPLIFRYNSAYDDFSSDTRADFELLDDAHFSTDGVLSELTISNGRLYHDTTSALILPIAYNKTGRLLESCKITTKITTDTSVAYVAFSHILKTNATDSLYVEYSPPSGELSISTVLSGQLAAVAITSEISTSYWIVSSIVGNLVTAEVWFSEPTSSGTANYSVTATLTGANATAFGTGVYSKQGLWWSASDYSNEMFVEDFRIEAITPADTYINCKKLSPIAGIEKQSGKHFRRDFQISLAASDPRIYSSTEIKSTKVPTTTTRKGRYYPRTFDYEYTTLLDSTYYVSSDENTVVVSNEGNFESFPTIKLEGGMTNPILVNVTNGTQMVFNVDIAEGDYYLIDLQNRTIEDSYGVSRISALSADSDFIFLSTGDNTIMLGVDEYSGSPLLSIWYKYAWI